MTLHCTFSVIFKWSLAGASSPWGGACEVTLSGRLPERSVWLASCVEEQERSSHLLPVLGKEAAAVGCHFSGGFACGCGMRPRGGEAFHGHGTKTSRLSYFSLLTPTHFEKGEVEKGKITPSPILSLK